MLTQDASLGHADHVNMRSAYKPPRHSSRITITHHYTSPIQHIFFDSFLVHLYHYKSRTIKTLIHGRSSLPHNCKKIHMTVSCIALAI
ncbi:hypothetical protein BASA50_008733 [Batrachochytrium salamandrivorans]|uniref:Uncharacterized protein n=1 Tax=Batrachochytrium salamandrivorans TaxID=1357716 RepID=A0ABQ8F3D6_9FUNG|nr:hypothetical protein BASA62_008282 [Batrachochytrium salamandrivorans]KAH6591379.1 hypothetical protein BASA50_008733 [Batrachochytrium salamandrivorans]